VSARAYQVVHITDYTYDADVSASYGRAHLLPREEPGQRVLASSLVVDPAPAEVHEHVDYHGNTSTYFRLSEPHRALRVTSTSQVEVDRTPPTWTALDVPRVPDGAVAETGLLAVEMALPSPMIPPSAAVAAYAATVLLPGRPMGEALSGFLDAVARDFTYQAGSTTVSTPLETVLADRHGVCQDFAHLMIGCLRSAGLSASYVSGYLQTMPPPGKPRLVGADASHAWVSVLVPGVGWVDLDPTNHQPADHRYIVVARGRDYSDVPPLKGVIYTRSSKSTLHVSVDVQPVTPVLF
jgi:transglutaminase-like putative cysteine protease